MKVLNHPWNVPAFPAFHGIDLLFGGRKTAGAEFKIIYPGIMAVNIEVNCKALKTEDSSHVQYIPCQINHDGEAAVDKFFTTYVQEETVKVEGEEKKGEQRTLV